MVAHPDAVQSENAPLPVAQPLRKKTRRAKAKTAVAVSVKLALLFVLLLIAVVLLLWDFRAPVLKNWVFPRVALAIGVPVRGDIESISRSRGLTVGNFQVGTDESPIFKADRIRLVFDPVESGRLAWNRKLLLGEVVIDGAELTLRKDAAGNWIGFPQNKTAKTPAAELTSAPNVSTPAVQAPVAQAPVVQTPVAQTAAAEGSFLLRRFAVNDSKIFYEDRAERSSVAVTKFSAELTNFGQSRTAEFKGSFALTAKLGDDRNLVGEFAFSKLSSALGQSFEPHTFGFAVVATALAYQSPQFNHVQEKLSAAGEFTEKDNVWRLTSAAVAGSKPGYSLRGTGDLGLVKGFPGNFSLDAAIADLDLAQLKIADLLDAQGTINAKASFAYRPKESTLGAQISAANLAGSATNIRVTKPAELVLRLESAFSPEHLQILALSGSLGTAGKTHLAFQGSTNIALAGAADRKSSLAFEAESVDVDALRELVVRREPPLAVATEPIAGAAAAAEEELPADQPPFYGSELSYELKLHKLHAAGRTLAEIDLSGAVTADEVQVRQGTALIGPSKIFAEGVYRLTGANQFSVKLHSADLDLEAAHRLAVPDQTGPDAQLTPRVLGSFKKFAVFAAGSLLDTETLKKSLQADLRTEMSEVTLPARLSEVVPFNVLFLPAKAVSSVTSLFPTGLAPAEVAAQGAAVSESLKHSDSFRVEQGRLRLKVRNQSVRINQLKIGTILLPDIYFSGTVGFDQKLAIDSGVKLLGVELPLPIAGTLRSPLPDMTAFAEGLVTHFAKSIVMAPVNAIRSGFDSGSGSAASADKSEQAESSGPDGPSDQPGQQSDPSGETEQNPAEK